MNQYVVYIPAQFNKSGEIIQDMCFTVIECEDIDTAYVISAEYGNDLMCNVIPSEDLSWDDMTSLQLIERV